QLDWEQVVRQAKQNHAYRMVLLGIALAKNVMGATLSESMNSLIQRDRSVSRLMQHACLYMFGKPANPSAKLFVETLAPTPAQPTRRFSPTRFRLAVCDRWQDQVQYGVWRMLVPNVRDRQRVVLPRPLSFLYYLIRPLRLVGEHLRWVEHPRLGSQHNLHPLPTTSQNNLPLLTSDRPQTRTDLDVYCLDDERIIYCSNHELGIALNPSSSMIWDCCDGTHTLEDMGVMISQQVGCSPEAIIEDIWMAVLEFRRLRLLVES
ncbi:MAG TPA: PqqD family protein, partial [Elainellaceae cyanobacterium]